MHYSWATCNQAKDKNAYWDGAAQCQVDIPPEAAWMAMTRAIEPLVAEKGVEVADLNKLAEIPNRKRAIIPIAATA